MNIDLKGLDKEFWNNRYLEMNTGWDMGFVSPPIKAYIDQLENKDLKILIPGAGNGYEAQYLIEQGFTNVTVVDISPEPIKHLKEKLKDSPHFHPVEGDFFKHADQYDLIIEQTFFCAIHPSLREDYTSKMHQLLSENGKLVGLLFEMDKPEGPPFGGDREEYQNLFQDKFEINKMDLCYNSHPARQGKELWIDLRKK